MNAFPHDCVICARAIDMRKDITTDFAGCTCYAHAECLPDPLDVEYDDTDCPVHKTTSPLRDYVQQVQEPMLPGEDWVNVPVPPPGKLATVYSSLRDVFVTDDRDVGHPRQLLKQHKPIPWIIRNKQWGLGHLHAMGVTLKDFLDNKYTWDELRAFHDLGDASTPRRRQQTLVALGLTADMLIDYERQLPMDQLRADCDLTPVAIATKVGLGFHPVEGLRSPQSAQWTLDHVIYLGFTFKDLLRCGLKYHEQWDELRPTSQHLRALGNVTRAQIDSALTHRDAPEQEQPKKEQPVYVLRDATDLFRRRPAGLRRK